MKVSQEVIDDMRQEAQSQLAEPGHEDVIIANYDYNASVNSRDLLAILDELEELRSKFALTNQEQRVSVLPETCGACQHMRPYDGKFLWCAHEEMPSSSKVIRDGVPDPLCPIRAKLAKVTP